MNVHLAVPLLMHTSVKPLLAVCSAVCGAAGFQRDRRMVYALDHNPHNYLKALCKSV